MLFVIDIILNFVAIFGMGLFVGMSIPGALLTMIIVQAVGMLVGAILGAVFGEGEVGTIGVICLVLRIVLIIVFAINLFIVPNEDERYEPITVIAGSYDGQPPFEEGNIKNIPTGRSYYIRVETAVQVNGWLRRLTIKNIIPISVEFSNPDIAEIKIDSDSSGTVIEPERKDDKIIYHLEVVARAKPEKRQVTFKVTPKSDGEQPILVIYEKRVSKNNTRYMKTLEYVK